MPPNSTSKTWPQWAAPCASSTLRDLRPPSVHGWKPPTEVRLPARYAGSTPTRARPYPRPAPKQGSPVTDIVGQLLGHLQSVWLGGEPVLVQQPPQDLVQLQDRGGGG
jgi:hypothetical protein